MIFGHDGPAGTLPVLPRTRVQRAHPDDPHRVRAATRCGSAAARSTRVVLHTFFTDETTRAACARCKRAAEEAGRDPARGTRLVLLRHGRRPPPGGAAAQEDGRTHGDLSPGLRRPDGEDEPLGPGVLQRFRADPVVQGFRGAIDASATTEQLEHVATLIPEEWLAPAATGSAERCVEKILRSVRRSAATASSCTARRRELEPISPSIAVGALPAGSIILRRTPAPPRRSGLHASLNRQRNRLSRLGLALRTLCSTGRFRKSSRDQPIFTFLLPRPFVSALHRARQLGDSSQGGFPTSFLSAQHTRP